MFISRIRAASSTMSRGDFVRRRRLQCVVELERLEIRTPLSAGLGSTFGAPIDAPTPPTAASPAANTIVDGTPVWLGTDGPAAQSAADLAKTQSNAFPVSPVLGYGGFPIFLHGSEGISTEGSGNAASLSVSLVSSWSGGLTTRAYSSDYLANSQESPFTDGNLWTFDSNWWNPSLDMPFYSNESAGFFELNTGASQLIVMQTWDLGAETTISFGPGLLALYAAPHDAGPGAFVDLNQQADSTSPFVETNNPQSGPPVVLPGVTDPFPLYLPVYRDFGAHPDLTASDAAPTVFTSQPSTQTGAISSLQIMAIPMASGRAASVAPITSGGGLAIQFDHASDAIGGGWMSYVVAGDWGSGELQPVLAADDSLTTLLDTTDASLAAIADGSAPLSVLLNGPEVPAPAPAGDLEQVAELLPQSESSLALVATLWSAPSDNPIRTSGDQTNNAIAPTSTGTERAPSWKAYLMGLDEAFEQTRQAIRQVDSTSQRQSISSQHDQIELDRQLEWERPIVPLATGWVSERRDFLSNRPASAVDDDAVSAIAADRMQGDGSPESGLSAAASEESRQHSEVASLVTAAALPLLSVVSASTALTGWLWSRRIRRRRLPGLPSLGSANSSPTSDRCSAKR
jgi:hypothetical protein